MANVQVDASQFRFALPRQQSNDDVSHMHLTSNEGSASAQGGGSSSNKNAGRMSVSKKNNSKKNRMTSNFEPLKTAVICGRGKACTSNPGNRKLRSLIKEFLDDYGKATNKVEKTEIVSSIMDTIKMDCGDEPAFVKKEDGTWWEVDDAFAREKIGCIFRDSLYTKYRSSTKAKLARRKQQESDEDQFQLQQSQSQQRLNAASAYGGMVGADLTSFASPSLMGFTADSSNLSKISNALSLQGASELTSKDAGLDFSKQQQHQLGLFEARDSLTAEQHSAHRRDLLRNAPSMMGLPGGSQPSHVESSTALGEAFDLLQHLNPRRNQTSQLLGGMQKRDNFFKDLLGAALAHPTEQQQPQREIVPSPPKQPKKSLARGKNISSRRKRRKGKQGNDVESLPDDISNIFD